TREEDGPRGCRLRADPRGHLLLGTADGGSAAGLDPRRARVLVLCRVLRDRIDRIRQGLRSSDVTNDWVVLVSRRRAARQGAVGRRHFVTTIDAERGLPWHRSS